MKCVFEVNSICRLCLRVDEKVFKLNSKHHKAFIESIIKLKNMNHVPTEDHYVCYICNALVTKTYNFMQTIWNSQEIICEILKNTDMVTKPMLEDINRHDNGLNPITLSSVLICDSEIFENRDTNTKIEIEFEDDNKGRSKHNKEFKENYDIKKFKKLAKNENSPIPISDEDIMETENFYLDEFEVVLCGDPLDGNCMDLNQKFKEDVTMKACEDLKPDRKNNKSVSLPKSETIKRKKEALTKTKDTTKETYKCKKKEVDEDYQPDTTSHSEDSEFDLYDDEGRRIRRPRDDRVYPRQCDHCKYEVLRKYDHYRHYQYVHPDIEYPYRLEKDCTCSICGKRVRKELLFRHEEGHSTQTFSCTLCPKVFPNRIKRYRHMKSVHPKKTFTCDYCSKIFKTKTDFLRHIRIHTGSKPFKCHICGDAFTHSGNRKIHIRVVHQNDKIVQKKKSQKVRGNNKHDSIDTGTFSDDIPIRSTKKNAKTKKLRKSKNQQESTDETLRKKNKSAKRADRNGKEVVSEDGKRKLKKKKTQMITDMNIDADHNNAEIDSDDEILITIKKRKDGENNVE